MRLTTSWTLRAGVDRITRDYSVKQNRDRALVATLANTGARVGEIAALKPADIQPGKLSVRGKTGYRALTISPNVEDLIRRQVSGGVVWASMRGGELTCSGIQLIVGPPDSQGWGPGPPAGASHAAPQFCHQLRPEIPERGQRR